MKLIPAIDLWDAKAVRFLRGDPFMSKVYSDNPVEVAKRWEAEGAKILHVVDLSAALDQGDNSSLVEEIIKTVNIPVEIGGGIRTIERAKELIDIGAERIIVGTKSVEEEFLDELIATVGADKLAIGVDVINSVVAVEGWKLKTTIKGDQFIPYLQKKGIKWIIYTDISRDGTLKGPNIGGIQTFSELSGVNFIASGGVSCLDDLRALKDQAPFIWGVITGKALYEETFTLSEANAIFE
ncbi:MAG: 1-(5-phosphoribosyl)-5-[(5-phosphoribosylamino)methylideneamino]imidazole-4-carboxamide isomerase [Candidatus Omnitrophica bacterium]|nr:1-(5-phosphoribosyl)-5-[(5-phosphoribosylamino)methylideneamino]imidazole-4-carboxamide isomerase [Candidatus Omnitrophota bacterium]